MAPLIRNRTALAEFNESRPTRLGCIYGLEPYSSGVTSQTSPSKLDTHNLALSTLIHVLRVLKTTIKPESVLLSYCDKTSLSRGTLEIVPQYPLAHQKIYILSHSL